MLKSIFKWLGIVLGVLIVLFVLFYVVVYFSTESRINKQYDVQVQQIQIPSDSVSYARGKRIATNRGCLGCHGNNLGGVEVFLPEGSPMGTLVARNITSGEGGIQYEDSDWIRVLRHGINKENKSVWFMPSHEVAHMSNKDMGDLINYVKHQPPVNNVVPKKELKPLGRVMVFLDKFPLLNAEIIDHQVAFQDDIIPSVTPQYGAYLATTCQGCHYPNLKGGEAFEKGKPTLPDISSTGPVGKWTEANFITAMRTGKRPDGKQLSDDMPYKYFNFTDDELKAIYVYLRQLK